ncbi:hypothetical protein [Mycobacterium sp. CnD-18-1]|uniref:hypothetical protein n=1 Tax=Mycobacterium sp. CnD-18-1 TaxID=2917744 RepID=UPI001EF2744D|nr:hypothetical protein [Mycobacterium sp. CnD-18-1]MCG7610384.1 hypothetical protein [Mycobacterium sp. CnD-18-1]
MITWARVCQRIDQLLLGHDDDRPATAEETRRAEGTQHAQTPGEVSGANSPDPSPSPGDLAGMDDSDLLELAADAIYAYARSVPNVLDLNGLLNLADELRDRAAQFAALENHFDM